MLFFTVFYCFSSHLTLLKQLNEYLCPYFAGIYRHLTSSCITPHVRFFGCEKYDSKPTHPLTPIAPPTPYSKLKINIVIPSVPADSVIDYIILRSFLHQGNFHSCLAAIF